MGNIIGSLISGFSKVFGSLFGVPLDFLSGKSCSSVCGSTWDMICYIENFCVSHLLRLMMVLVLFYIVLLFFYLLNKTGICYCIGRSLCKMIWACFSSCFYACEYVCTLMWIKARRIKRIHRHRIEHYYTPSESDVRDQSMSFHIPRSIEMTRSISHRSRECRRLHMQRSLRPRSHRVRVGISKDAIIPYKHHAHKHVSMVHNIKVTQTSKFVKKGRNVASRAYRKQRW